MDRREQQAWALVGFGGIIIILLLLDFGDNQNVVETNTGGVSWPGFDPITLQLTNVPPGGYPFYLSLTQPGPGDQYTFQAGAPCGCGCAGASERAGLDLSAQIASLNSSIQNATINVVRKYFAGLPASDYWATNNSQVEQFNAAVGLPPPPYGS